MSLEIKEPNLNNSEYVFKYKLLCEYLDYINSELDVTKYGEWLETKNSFREIYFRSIYIR